VKGISPERLRLYTFLSTFCWDDYYFPMDGPFQNYTYFPKAPLSEVKDCWKTTLRLIREGRAPKEVGVYVHWPFCLSRCSYCFCSMRVPNSAAETARYAAALESELRALSPLFERTSVGSLWLGGGTPTFMSADELDRLLSRLRASFALEPGAQVYVEASPATLSPAKVEVLLKHGVNRVTLGLQSLDGSVTAATGRRLQTREAAERAFELVAGRGMLVDLDLMMGLEGQSKLSFLKDLAWVLRRRPDVLHLFAFDPRPQTLFSIRGKKQTGRTRGELRVLMELADRAVRAGGYRVSRLDPETLAPDCPEERQDSAARRLGASVLGLGASAVSHAFGSARYCHPLAGSSPAAAAGSYRLMRTGLGEEMRGFALRHLSLFGRLDERAFAALFGRSPLEVPGLGRALAELGEHGVLRRDKRELVYSGRDPVERCVVLKHLYSPRAAAALLQGREAVFRRFSFRPGGPWPEEVTDKIEGRNLFRVYFSQRVGSPTA